ncbi:hypothetical protein AVEN_83580-1 [Araneus ventricosus]|uniref:Uncharacterized protein n=1 Tax=Araneus ventricosus TaxID=182803 RepID=A0A4Y2PI63_ARAVE|nr:hypothetical protein AVEN_83580-1 [Araneus ventricosus]
MSAKFLSKGFPVYVLDSLNKSECRRKRRIFLEPSNHRLRILVRPYRKSISNRIFPRLGAKFQRTSPRFARMFHLESGTRLATNYIKSNLRLKVQKPLSQRRAHFGVHIVDLIEILGADPLVNIDSNDQIGFTEEVVRMRLTRQACSC